jgi:cytochrome c
VPFRRQVEEGSRLPEGGGEYKGKADAQEKLEKFLTSSPKVKFDDGSEEEHKSFKDKGAASNIVKWVLSL